MRYLNDVELQEIENQIRERSMPYDYDTKEYPIELLVMKYSPLNNEEPSLFIPDYQRDLVWKPNKQSKFIESLFLGVPVPPVFVAVVNETGKLEIIDGSQRIRTIVMYVNNTLELKSLEELANLNGTKFGQLTPARKRKFLNLTIRFHVVEERADLAIRADIFDRLNSTGKVLTSSEVRRGAFANIEFYRFIIEMSRSQHFTQLMPDNMADTEKEELTLRFFAYSENYLDFKHDVAIFLNRYVERKQREGFNNVALEEAFINMTNFVRTYFPAGFSKTVGARQVPRVRFEAISVGIHLALQDNPDLIPANMDWLDSQEFRDFTTTDASNNRLKLLGRIQFVRDVLLNNINSNSLTY